MQCYFLFVFWILLRREKKKDKASFWQMDRIKFLTLGLFIAQYNSVSHVVIEVNGLLQKHCFM